MSTSANSATMPPPEDKLEIIRVRFSEYLGRLKRKIAATEAFIQTGAAPKDQHENFNYERQGEDLHLEDRLVKWLAISHQTAYSGNPSDWLLPEIAEGYRNPTIEEISHFLLTERQALEAVIDARSVAYKLLRQNIRDGLGVEYASSRERWREATEKCRPSFIAWNDLQDRLERAKTCMETRTQNLHRHRVHIAALTDSLRTQAASKDPSDDDGAVQLQIFAETWQLVSATDTYLGMEKRFKVAVAALERLEARTTGAKAAANVFRGPLKDAVAALKNTKRRMKAAGMEVPGGNDQHEDDERALGERSETKGQRKKQKKKKLAAKDGEGAAISELMHELTKIQAVVPGTEELWRALEGSTGGRPQRQKPKKVWVDPFEVAENYGSWDVDYPLMSW